MYFILSAYKEAIINTRIIDLSIMRGKYERKTDN
jgi:hypothetical protein